MKNEELESLNRRTDRRLMHYIAAASLTWLAFVYWFIEHCLILE